MRGCETPHKSALHDVLEEADVVWVRLKHLIDSKFMSAAPRLRVIVTPTTGLNHIDLDAAERRGIRILSLRGEIDFLKEVRATAELTIGLMLALLRHIPEAARHVRQGDGTGISSAGMSSTGRPSE